MLIFKLYVAKLELSKHANIIILNEAAEREDIVNAMQTAHFLIAPSSREGFGLNLYEAKSCGCELITTDASPMNYHQTPYLCSVSGFKKERGLVPLAIVEEAAILEQLFRVCQDWRGNG